MGIWTKRILRIAGYAVNLALAVIVVCAAYGGVVDPAVSTLPAIFAMTFPFWLGCAVAP